MEKKNPQTRSLWIKISQKRCDFSAAASYERKTSKRVTMQIPVTLPKSNIASEKLSSQ